MGKIILLAGSLLAVFVAVTAMYAGWSMNAQGEYDRYPADLVFIYSGWSAAIFFCTAVLASVVDVFIRSLKRMLTQDSTVRIFPKIGISPVGKGAILASAAAGLIAGMPMLAFSLGHDPYREYADSKLLVMITYLSWPVAFMTPFLALTVVFEEILWLRDRIEAGCGAKIMLPSRERLCGLLKRAILWAVPFVLAFILFPHAPSPGNEDRIFVSGMPEIVLTLCVWALAAFFIFAAKAVIETISLNR